jgi:hypothetical protein
VSLKSTPALGAYLNDHLAGSVMAIEMLERMVDQARGTALDGMAGELLREIREDQQVLKGVLEKTGVAENPIKKAGAWLAEKAGRLKATDPGEDSLSRLEMLETLSLGVLGKLKLWLALEKVAPGRPGLEGLDFKRLQVRARNQHDLIEAQRLDAAREAL